MYESRQVREVGQLLKSHTPHPYPPAQIPLSKPIPWGSSGKAEAVWEKCVERAEAEDKVCRPASRQTISPGTSSPDGISVCLPSRFTMAWGLVSFFNASIAFLALFKKGWQI